MRISDWSSDVCSSDLSDADTFILRREKTFEYAIDILFGDAWAIVVNRKRSGGIRAELGFDKDFSRIGDGLNAVHQKIDDDLLKLDPVSHDNRKGSGRQREFDRGSPEVMSDKQHSFQIGSSG